MVEDNWASQLKKIEREFEGLPPEPSPALKKLQSEEERRAKEKAQQRAAMFGAAARLILVFALGAAIVVWPYSRECGWGWFGYVGVEGVIVAGGIWVAFRTWRGRLPKMHAFSLLIVLAGLILIAAEVLPRIGYAVTDPNHPPQLWCPVTTTTRPATTRPATTMTDPQPVITTTNALPDTTVLEQRVRYATQSLGSRWKESTGDLARQLRPHQAALEQTLHRELQLRREP